ncbi:hypothetical protein VP01_1035g4 [Puccinia sorghi]|uniref:Uncharacterized protein n=1 Tax=Puccinia sorghi TaxID=27349 RepID=A0A0L6VUR1_9BASI|nr:hypothetical protein VP01_1035g4 [Puccinia sorghi]
MRKVTELSKVVYYPYINHLKNNRCFHLSLKHLSQELSNPLVHMHLNFYPEDPQGFYIFASYQSAKWLQLLPCNFWVQMVSFCAKHFYIFEPVVVLGPNMPIMIPVFFFTKNNIIYSKCVTPQIVN